MSMMLGFLTLAFLALLMVVKMLMVMELRSREREYRQNLGQIAEREADLDTSRRKYLIALKSEGVAKHKLSQMKTRFANLKQHMDQIELTVRQQEVRKGKELEQKLEALVMNALGGPSVRRDSQFRRVMKVIYRLIELEKKNDSEELIQAIQEKIDEMGHRGLVEAADRGEIPAVQQAAVQANGQEPPAQERKDLGENREAETSTKAEAELKPGPVSNGTNPAS